MSIFNWQKDILTLICMPKNNFDVLNIQNISLHPINNLAYTSSQLTCIHIQT